MKPKNILIKEGEVRISDFGIYKLLGGNTSLSLQKGTRNYYPPEMLENLEKESNENNFISKKIDMFSLGILCHEIFANGKNPFDTSDNVSIVGNIRKGNYKIDYNLIQEESSYDLVIKGILN